VENRPTAGSSALPYTGFASALLILFLFAILTLFVQSYWPVSMFEVGVCVLAIATLVVFRHVTLQFSWPMIPVASVVCCGLLQELTGHTIYRFETWNSIAKWVTMGATLLIGLFVFRDRRTAHFARMAMIWFAGLLAVEATLQTFTTNLVYWKFPTDGVAYLMGPILYHNHYAAIMLLLLPLPIAEAVENNIRMLLYAGIAGLIYASIIASGSRSGALIATSEVIFIVVLVLLRARNAKASSLRPILAITGILVSAAVFSAAVGWHSVIGRLTGQDAFPLRRQFVTSSIAMLKDHPWFGFGLGTWSTAYPQYALIDPGKIANQAHNDWLQWAVECGIFVAILLLSLPLWCVRRSVRTLWGIGVLAFFAEGLMDYPFSRPALASAPMLLIAMLSVAEERNPR